MCRKGWGGPWLPRHQSGPAQLTSVPSRLPGGRWLSRWPLPWMKAVPASSTSEARPFRGVGQVETTGLLIASLSHARTRTRGRPSSPLTNGLYPWPLSHGCRSPSVTSLTGSLCTTPTSPSNKLKSGKDREISDPSVSFLLQQGSPQRRGSLLVSSVITGEHRRTGSLRRQEGRKHLFTGVLRVPGTVLGA